MKKSILAILLAVIMLAAVPVSAASVVDYFNSLPIPASINMDVNANIQVKRTTIDEYSDGPVNVRKSSSQDWPKFDFQATLYMDSIRAAFKDYSNLSKRLIKDTPMEAEFADIPVYGGFTVSATYPASLSVPESFLNADNMEGFSENAKHVFKEISRKETTEGKWKTLFVEITVKSADGQNDFITQGALEANLETYLPDFTFTCEGVETSAYGSLPVYGAVKGYTHIGAATAEDSITSLNYKAVQLSGEHDVDGGLSSTVKVIRVTSSDSGSSSTIIFPTTDGKDNEVIISFDVDGDTVVVDAVNGDGEASVDLDTITKPTKEGYYFDGWYADPACMERVSGKVTVNKDTVFYGKWINTTAPGVLNSDNHMAYVAGYEDGTVRPENFVTREEIAAILYRLLRDEHRNSIFSRENSFADVEAERWSAAAVSTMANGGYIKGYPDGTFAPAKPVTRAELVTILGRFYQGELLDDNNGFYDVAGHWAEAAVVSAVSRGWIDGYEDGTFRPDNNVSRAEAMTILNRMLVRHVDAEGLCEGVKVWPDNAVSAWYYYQVVEATTSHTFNRRADMTLEDWTVVTENPAWPE